MRVVEFLNVAEADLKESKKLSEESKALVEGLSILKKKIVEIKENKVWPAYEALRKAQVLGLDDVTEKQEALYRAQNEINIEKKKHAKKDESIHEKIAAMSAPYLRQVQSVVELELREVNNPSVPIFNRTDKIEKYTSDRGDFKRYIVRSNAKAIEKAQTMLMNLSQSCRGEFLSMPLHEVLKKIEAFQSKYNEIDLKECEEFEMSIDAYKEAGGR